MPIDDYKLEGYPKDLKATLAYRTIRRLERLGTMKASDTVLIVFGGEFDVALFRHLGYSNVVLSNIDADQVTSVDGEHCLDASTLPFDDDSFDHVFAHAGLHHASRPHQALCEMYRVAKLTVIFFEAQDSFTMRVLARLGLVATYEWNAIIENEFGRGGVDDKPIPNHVLRWTPREVDKVIRSLDPIHIPRIHYFREWGIYYERFRTRLKRTPLRRVPPPLLQVAVNSIGRVANRVVGWQGNSFGVCIEKHGSGLQEWIKIEGGSHTFDRSVRHQR